MSMYKDDKRPTSSAASCVSMKTNRSLDIPLNLRDKAVTSEVRQKIDRVEATSSAASCVSMKTNRSLDIPLNLRDKAVTSEVSEDVFSDSRTYLDVNCGFCCEKAVICQTHITQQHTDAALQKHTMIDGNQQVCDQPESYHDDVLQRVKDIHKSKMKNKFEILCEGIKQQDNETLLDSIYTQLYIVEGESEGVNKEHEVLQIDKEPKTQKQYKSIHCNNIFNVVGESECDQERTVKIKSVLTKGIAGIGKTVSVQKFILDWVEGTANQDIDFMFVLPFRELNLIKDDQYSLHKLLLDFHPELQDLDSKIYEQCKVVFVFDGLDESRIELMFSESVDIFHVTKMSSVSVLISNLIKGDLLPSAHIWITSRPAAANQIPPEHINRVTEIQGFNDPQKEEYFRKKISDQQQAQRIISHIKTSRSLHIMCHIPVFCWISATVLQNILKKDHSAEIPKTLTEMYIHFLNVQTNVRCKKYDENNETDPRKLLQCNREVLLKLSELAFKQLMEGNVMFYEEDLRDCGIDATEAVRYSGICTQIFKEESVIYQRKVYCFIHLSFQEFLAAFYVFHSYVMTTEALKMFDTLHNFLEGAIEKALECENGHLDLFLRFLLGISLESNQRLLQGLLTHTEKSTKSIQKTTAYIKNKIKDGCDLSADKSINLFLCLFEMNDQTMYVEIQNFLKSERNARNRISSAHCSAIAYILQMSEKVLDELNPQKYDTSEEGRRALLPALRNCTKALFADCNLTDQSCEIVSSALRASNSPLKELDMSNNDLQDSGVKILCAGLENPHCQLEILRLSGCMVTAEGCAALASALRSNPSHLRELDLSYNHPGDSGVQLLSALLEHPHCKLDKLILDHGAPFRITPGLRKYACDLTVDPNTAHIRLLLSERNRKISCVQPEQPYPDHAERFERYEQVLCKESLSDRCYWEVDWNGWSHISVTYKGISRKGGSNCRFGLNEKSWSLYCCDTIYSAWHNKKSTNVPLPSFHCRRVGVYLDCMAGTLSYYSVSDTNTCTHIYTFHSMFTEPLYAGFGFYSDSSVHLCEM